MSRAPSGWACHLLGHGVARVQQALEDHPAVADVVVEREVDPADSPVGEAPQDLVLTRDQFARLELRGEREDGAAVGAHPLRVARPRGGGTSDGALASVAVAFVLRQNGIGQEHRQVGGVGGVRHRA